MIIRFNASWTKRHATLFTKYLNLLFAVDFAQELFLVPLERVKIDWTCFMPFVCVTIVQFYFWTHVVFLVFFQSEHAWCLVHDSSIDSKWFLLLQAFIQVLGSYLSLWAFQFLTLWHYIHALSWHLIYISQHSFNAVAYRII